ncbi:MAG TPA: ferrochelatase, partial [Phenylobacterium sp.]|nr:ferrochelatase [Phenylobacterium sp.]
MKKLAVVLFNLGGPDGPDAVQPFLFNLFRDPAIIGLPAPARYPLAALISTTRRKSAQANYAIMGG